jgi:hypothetical protein
VAAAFLSAAGCSLVDHWAAPSEPFGDFSMGEFGGIDGRKTLCGTVRLLLARLIETAVVPCTSTAHYQLQIDTNNSGPKIAGSDCGFPQRQPEFRALTALLENAFGV